MRIRLQQQYRITPHFLRLAQESLHLIARRTAAAAARPAAFDRRSRGGEAKRVRGHLATGQFERECAVEYVAGRERVDDGHSERRKLAQALRLAGLDPAHAALALRHCREARTQRERPAQPAFDVAGPVSYT